MAHDPRFRVERVVTLALVAAACAFALYHDRALPAPLGLDAPASVFSEARAAAFASSLDAPRLAGSDAEHAALEKLERALRGVAAETRAASSGRVVVDVLRTRHSGTFPLRGPGVRETREQTMAYDRLDALAARVRVSVPFGSLDDGEAERDAERHALLFAAHVDTVHVSPGGCDNAANVAVVLETVRAFAAGLCGSETEHANDSDSSYDSSSHKYTYVTPLVAMFVSAEEDGFMGARGVVRDHPWFEAHVAAFANFEAMGSGGPHRAFRATVGGSSSNVLRLYARGAPRPSGTVLASDVFSSGFIKSDTDFRVFRDDGNVPGIDLAFVERTRLYHTPRDTMSALARGRPGSMQGSGENALGFARAFFENERSLMMRSTINDTRHQSSTTHQKDGGKGGRFLGVTKGGVSTTARRDRGVRRGAKETASSETSSLKKKKRFGGSAVSSLTVWFAFPSFQNAFVVFDVDGAQMATAVALAAVTSTALATNLLGFGFGARIERDPEAPRDTATLLAAIVVGVAGAAVAFVAAPVAGGLAALATASVTGTPTPWAKSLGAFVLCVVPSSVAAALGTLDATRRLTRVLFESAANDSRRFQSRRDSFAATANETRGEEKNANETSQDAAQRTASHVTRLHARADRVALVGAALFLALLASYAFFRNVAGAYLFAVPAFGIFLGVPFAGTEDDHSMDPSRSRKKSIGSFAFGAFARAAPLAFAASLAFPTCFALVDLAHGMAPRSRPPPGTSEYLYDIVCGVVAGGAVAASAFPSLAFLVSTRDSPCSSSRTRSVFRFSFAKAFAVTMAASHVAYAYAAIDAPSFTEDFPQQLSAFAAVTSGNVSDAALVFLPAGPGSVERAFKQTLDQLEQRSGSFGSFTSPRRFDSNARDAAFDAANGEDAEKITKNTKYACDGDYGDYGVLRRWDLASYSLAGSGACAALSTSLSRELTEANAKSGNEKKIVTEVRVRAGAPRAAAGNARVVPITVDTRGATRWVIAVDARCAKRVAFAQGQDAEREDAEAEAEAEAGERRAGNQHSRSLMKTRASPPVGPWRLASNGRAGSGTGTRRYAAFGVGGRDARERPRPITVWIETHAVTDGSTDGAVSKKCARDAVRVRADFDFETATAAAARAATPAWVVPFAKHHTPLKLAVLAVAGLNMTEGHVAVT